MFARLLVVCSLFVAMPVLASSLAGDQSFSLASRHTGKTYRIQLSVPQLAPPAGGYPVLYALDGDFSFPVLHQLNPRSAAVFQRLATHEGPAPEPGVVVAIGYGRPFSDTLDLRAEDYTIAANCQPCDKLSPRHGGAMAFSRFLLEELRPAIAARLSVNPARQSLFGHSYGGLFTLQQYLHEPAAFAAYFAISPSIWFGQRAILAQPARVLPEGLSPRLLAIWVGDEEEGSAQMLNLQRQQRLQQNRMIGNARDLAARETGKPGVVTDFRLVPGHDHGQMHLYAMGRVLALAFRAAGH